MKVLSFLNLLDKEGNLSITNVAVYIALVKMAFASQLNSCDVVALVGVLGNYAHKRFVNDGASSV